LGESHFRPQRAVLASPLVGATAVAARTKRIRVGLAVQVLPLANPIRVSEEAAIVDHLSEGRLVFGVGRSSFLEAYEGCNVDYAESRETFALAGKLGFPIFIRHQMDIPELQDLLKQYEAARHAAGFTGPNDVILQIAGYVADTAEKARSEPEAST